MLRADGDCPAGVCASAAGAGASLDALLATLTSADVFGELAKFDGGGSGSGGSGSDDADAGALFAAAAVGTAEAGPGLAPGQSLSLTVAHAWYYPHFYWCVLLGVVHECAK